jgi:type I restriction enzyme, R subunit
MEEDPFFYRKFSVLLQQAIDDYRNDRITDAEYLARVTDVMEQVRDGRAKEAPDILKERDLSRALFGALKDKMASASHAPHSETSGPREDPAEYRISRSSPAEQEVERILAEAACEMEDIIRKHAVVRWRENVDAQNRMRNDLDDFLFRLQTEKGIVMSYDQMDAILDAVIAIAIHRSDDV